MRGFVALTDLAWWQFLRARPEIDEVNFWRPGGSAGFSALTPGEPFFFKLRAPYNAVAGFGLFARFTHAHVWHAWDLFGAANGVASEPELLASVARLAREPVGPDRMIGCIAVSGVVFFQPDEWVDQPADWQRQIVSGRGYDLSQGVGRRLWQECLERAAARRQGPEWTLEAWDRERVGKAQLVVPRLGQASFRLAVLEAYGGACAVTTEHSLPAVEAAHIRPWARGGTHELPNGLPLRRDLHRLFDLGYVTVRPDGVFAVSPKLRHEFDNGRTDYALEGRRIIMPAVPAARPSVEHLAWHSEEVFRSG